MASDAQSRSDAQVGDSLWKPVQFAPIQCNVFPQALYLAPGSPGSNESQLVISTPVSEDKMLAAGQLWGFLSAGAARSYRIFNGYSGRCIDAAGNHDHPSDGTKIQQYDWQPAPRNQIWLFSGTSFMSGYTTAYACHALGTTSGQRVVLGRYDSGMTDSTFLWTAINLEAVQFYTLEPIHSGLLLTADPGGGGQLYMTPNAGDPGFALPTQMWAFIGTADGARLFNAYNGKCGDADGDSSKPSDGTKIIQYDWRPTQRNQLWKITERRSGVIPGISIASVYDDTKYWTVPYNRTVGELVTLESHSFLPSDQAIWSVTPVN
jgi:hypothetical protein